MDDLIVERTVEVSASRWDAVAMYLEDIQARFGVLLRVKVIRGNETMRLSIRGDDEDCVRFAEEFVTSICDGDASPTASEDEPVVFDMAPSVKHLLLQQQQQPQHEQKHHRHISNNNHYHHHHHAAVSPLVSAPASMGDYRHQQLTTTTTTTNHRRLDSVLFGVRLPPELAIVGDSRNTTTTMTTTGMKRPCRKLESEDSSYDSDGGADCCAASSHDELDRSLSETLAREYRDYVTATPTPTPSPPSKRDNVPIGSESTNYASKLEFALKLGYTEQQVQLTLARLGSNPTQNELLEELIKVSTVPGLEACAQDADDSWSPYDEEAVLRAGVLPSSSSSSSSKDSLLRHVVIDGSNVAMSHGNKEVFSCRGIRLAVDWFRARGHQDITVFVPKWRKESSKPEAPIKDQDVLLELEKERSLVFTPSRLVSGRRLVCYDDRYILNLAVATDGIVVSNDNYRDLASESPDYKRVVEERILMYSFVNDRFMPPDDPLGRNGPTLASFLKKPHAPLRGSVSTPVTLGGGDLPPLCPYGKKCTYGNKCKFLHPERGNLPHKTVTEKLMEKAQKRLLEIKMKQQQHLQMTMARPAGMRGSGGDISPVGASGKQPTKSQKSEECVGGSSSNSSGSNSSNSNGNSNSRQGLQGGRKMPLTRTVSGARAESFGDQFDVSLTGGLHGPRPVGPRLSDPQAPAYGHRKLQRQLTLNPEFDPRLLQMRSGAAAAGGAGLPPPPPPLVVDDPNFYVNTPPPGYKFPGLPQQQQQQKQPPLSPTPMLSQVFHQHHHQVSRIASAPDSRPITTMVGAGIGLGLGGAGGGGGLLSLGPRNSTSDSRLDLADAESVPVPPVNGVCKFGPISPPRRQEQQASEPTSQEQELEQCRFKIYYHLSHLFPEEQVGAAMRACPNETSPEKICAYILRLCAGVSSLNLN